MNGPTIPLPTCVGAVGLGFPTPSVPLGGVVIMPPGPAVGGGVTFGGAGEGGGWVPVPIVRGRFGFGLTLLPE